MVTGLEKDDDLESVVRAKPAFLRRVRIRGYKSIAFCDVTLEPLTILVGRNAAGKSNFLDALAFLRDAMQNSVSDAINRRGGWSSIVCRATDAQTISFEIEADFPSIHTHVATYRVEISAQHNASPSITTEAVKITDQTTQFDAGFVVHDGNIHEWKSKLETPEEIDIINPRHLFTLYRDRLLLSVVGTQPFVDLAEGLRWMGFCNFYPDAIRLPQKPKPGILLEKDGRNLASVIETTQEIEEGDIERAGRYLTAIARTVEFLRVVKVGDFETVRFQVARNGKAQPLEFDASSLSDGTLRAFAALVAVFQIVLPHGYPSVVAIEEPEMSLHPGAMRALVDALDEATLRTQILLTTQSAEMLDNPTIRPANLRVVEMIDGQTIIGRVDEASVEIVARKLNSLGGLERENQLEPDLDDQDRQEGLAKAQQE